MKNKGPYPTSAMKRHTAEVTAHIKDYYGIEPDFLWENSPSNAAFRHRGHKKWFAALLMDLPCEKLGLSGRGAVDIINLKCDPRLIGTLLDGTRYFPAYHMNKEHWVSLLLDGSIPMDEISFLIETSYQLTDKKK